MSEIYLQIDRPLSSNPGNAQRLRSLLEWERTFLAEQQWLNSHGGQAEDHKRSPDGSPGAERFQALRISAPIATGVEAMSSGISPDALSSTGKGPRESTLAGPGSCLIRNDSPSVGVGPAARLPIAPSEAATQEAPAYQRSAWFHTLRPPPQPGMLVRLSNQSVQVWMRQPGVEGSAGLEMVSRLREFLLRTGLRLASLTVNGQLQWQAPEAVVQDSLSVSPAARGRVDKKI